MIRLRPRVQRHCRECGRPMGRRMVSRGYDGLTGRRLWGWAWGCDGAYQGWRRAYLNGRPYHDGHGIPTSPARKRLEIGRHSAGASA